MPIYEEKEKLDGKKRYYIRTYVTDENGNSKQITKHNKAWVGLDGKIEAQRQENILKDNVYSNNNDITLEELTNEYIANIEKKLKLSTIKNNKDNIRLYILPYFKNKKIKNITNTDILKWHDYILTKGLSNRFNRDIHLNLVTILNFACKFYNLDKNVASITGNFERPKGSIKKQLNFLTIEEFNNFIIKEDNNIYRNFFTILFFTGMRKGELWALKWEDINFNTNEIYIHNAFNRVNKEITVPKTNKSNRTIVMLTQVIESLKNMKKYKDNDYVFYPNKITSTTLARKCDINCKKANIKKNIRIHDFRHSFASMCIKADVKIEVLSNYLGHENISTTLDIYSHLYPNSQNEIINKIDTFLSKQDQKQDQQNKKAL